MELPVLTSLVSHRYWSCPPGSQERGGNPTLGGKTHCPQQAKQDDSLMQFEILNFPSAFISVWRLFIQLFFLALHMDNENSSYLSVPFKGQRSDFLTNTLQ